MKRNGRSLTTIVLRYRESPAWASIKTLRKNLLRAYRIALPQAELVSVSRQSSRMPAAILRSLRTAQTKRKKSLLRLIFVETTPPPRRLLEILTQIFSRGEVELTFHVYGDFTLLSPEWAQVVPLLEGFRVRFIVASRAHSELVGNLVGPHTDREICPLASDESTFRFTGANHFRRRWKIPPAAPVAIYTGRLSLEKKPDLILQVARQLDEFKTGADLRLVICGKFDDVGEQFGAPDRQENFRDKWRKALTRLPMDLRSRVIMTGSLRPKNLAEALSASHVFISLSTHHDEDFGLSPAESLMVGTPCVLSDWGGFRDFQSLKNHGHPACDLVPIRLENDGPTVDVEGATRAVHKILRQPLTDLQKKHLAGAARRRFGIRAVALRLREINQTSPAVFRDLGSGLLSEHSLRVMGLRHGFAAFREDRRKDALYLKVYASYYSVKIDQSGPKKAAGARRSKKSK